MNSGPRPLKIAVVSDCRIAASNSFLRPLRRSIRHSYPQLSLQWKTAIASFGHEVFQVLTGEILSFQPDILVLDCPINDFNLPAPEPLSSLDVVPAPPAWKTALKQFVTRKWPGVWHVAHYQRARWTMRSRTLLWWATGRLPRVSIAALSCNMRQALCLIESHGARIVLITPFAPDRLSRFRSPVIGFYARDIYRSICELSTQMDVTLCDLWAASEDLRHKRWMLDENGHLSDRAQALQTSSLEPLLARMLKDLAAELSATPPSPGKPSHPARAP